MIAVTTLLFEILVKKKFTYGFYSNWALLLFVVVRVTVGE